MRRRRVDANQAEIVKALRELGATVLHLHTLGRGAPDIAIGYGGLTLLAEIKDGTKSKSRRELTADEGNFAETWTGGVYLIESLEHAENAVRTLRRWSEILRAGLRGGYSQDLTIEEAYENADKPGGDAYADR